MPAIPTKINEVDRKLQSVVLTAARGKNVTASDLAEKLYEKQLESFSFFEHGTKKYKSQRSIVYYVGFARIVGLLDENFYLEKDVKLIRSLENFQDWLSDVILQYMNQKNSSLTNLSLAVQELFSQPQPYVSPYLNNVFGKIKRPKPSYRNFCVCLKIISLLRPDTLQIRSRRMLLMPDVLAEE